MKKAYTFTVPGNPQGKQRARTVFRNGHGHSYTPSQTVIYENWIKVCYQRVYGDHKFVSEPVLVRVVAYFPVPKSAPKRKREGMLTREIRPVKKPDIDNILKSVLDALNGLAYTDDAQVCDIHAEKWYDTDPRVVVTIVGDTE